MLKLLLKTLGWLLAHTPEIVLYAISVLLGDFLFFVARSRRRLVLGNLHHAFPERPPEWHRRIGRKSCRRLIETGLLSFATPFLSEQRLRTIIAVSPDLLAAFAEHRLSPAPTLMCSPHLAYWEAMTSMPLVIPGRFPEFGTIFRPLDNAAANEWVTHSRERFGIKLLSRKEGFSEAMKILRRGNFMGLLFDQNAGMQGALTTLFGRVCSTTELPGLLAARFDARVFGLFPRRRSFWRIEIDVHRILCTSSTEDVTLSLNRWLEATLTADDNLCASWLWMHNRWRHQDVPEKRFRLEAKRNSLPADLSARNLAVLPRRTRIWIRLPNWLGDVVMAVPLLRALRVSRPDAEITVIAKAPFLPLLHALKIADKTQALPARGFGYFAHFWRLRDDYPDVYLLLTNSVRGDLEAWFTRCRQRFGLVRPGRWRPLLTHCYRVPAEFDESKNHQLTLWENLLKHFGLAAPLPLAPIDLTPLDRDRLSVIGLIPGSENTPAKRWPISHWRALIDALPDRSFILLGTANDQAITSAIAAGFASARVQDLAGKTDLIAFGDRLRRSRLLVTNDTGGMHLANLLGIPLVALFGPTNPVRTGPVFAAPTTILQPPGCPPTGGSDLANLPPSTVIAAVTGLLGVQPVRV